jgi:hypothetical protein
MGTILMVHFQRLRVLNWTNATALSVGYHAFDRAAGRQVTTAIVEIAAPTRNAISAK